MPVKKEKEIYTPEGNRVELLRAGVLNGAGSSTALVIGVFHGDEPEGEYLVTNLMNDTETIPGLLASGAILFIPCLNPDGRLRNTRENSNKIDLNRDFPTHNRSNPDKPLEIETQFVVDIIEKYRPERILAIHSPLNVINYDGPAEKIAENMSKLNGYPIQTDIGYPTPGSLGTYAGKERRIPVITLELPENGEPEKLWIDNRKALHYFLLPFIH